MERLITNEISLLRFLDWASEIRGRSKTETEFTREEGSKITVSAIPVNTPKRDRDSAVVYPYLRSISGI